MNQEVEAVREQAQKQRPRLLIVEDDEEIRVALSEALSDLGYDVTSQPTAEDALHELERKDFDAVLTDVKMPGMDGIELCRRLSGDRPNLPLVVMTAFGDLDSAVGALRAGAFDFITKPFAVDQVNVMLDRALEQGKASPIIVRLAEI